jgi:hypothetical protein
VRQIGDLALFDASFAELICYQPMLDVLETLFESSEFSFNYLIGRPKASNSRFRRKELGVGTVRERQRPEH